MQRFFPDFDSLDRFTLSLRALGDQVSCPHCLNTRQLISHGRVYKQRSISRRVIVGKRVFCSNRYQHQGCGRTFQLYVALAIPGLRYGTSEVFRFLSSLRNGHSLEAAYTKATGQTDPRHGWRWLQRLQDNLTHFRCALQGRLEPSRVVEGCSRRLKLLLTTVHALFEQLPECPCVQFQCQQQRAFM